MFDIIRWHNIQEFNFLPIIFQRRYQEREVDRFNDKNFLQIFVCAPYKMFSVEKLFSIDFWSINITLATAIANTFANNIMWNNCIPSWSNKLEVLFCFIKEKQLNFTFLLIHSWSLTAEIRESPSTLLLLIRYLLLGFEIISGMF